MTEPSDDLARMIAMLQEDFMFKLPAEISEIEQLWHRLLGGDAPLVELKNLMARVHGIAGAGAMFYQAAVRVAALEMEQCLELIQAAGRLPNSEERRCFESLISALRQAA